MARDALSGNQNIMEMTKGKGKPQAGARAKPATAAPVKKPARKKPGPPPFQPTPEQRQLVMLAAAIGMTHEQIGRQVNFPDGIHPETLRKHFADELAQGPERIGLMVARNLVAIASDKTHKASHIAAMFYLKARRGWRDGHGGPVSAEVEVPGKGGDAPVKFTLKIGDREPKAEDGVGDA